MNESFFPRRSAAGGFAGKRRVMEGTYATAEAAMMVKSQPIEGVLVSGNMNHTSLRLSTKRTWKAGQPEPIESQRMTVDILESSKVFSTGIRN